MTITTQDLIRFFPLEEPVKKDLLERFDTLPANHKAQMVKVLWDSFYMYYDFVKQRYTKEARDKLLTGEEKPDGMFEARIVEKTEKEIELAFQGISDQSNLEEARKAMEMIVKEIHASKLAKKKPTKAN